MFVCLLARTKRFINNTPDCMDTKAWHDIPQRSREFNISSKKTAPAFLATTFVSLHFTFSKFANNYICV